MGSKLQSQKLDLVTRRSRKADRAFVRQTIRHYHRDVWLPLLVGKIESKGTLEPTHDEAIAALKNALRAVRRKRRTHPILYSRHRHMALRIALGGELFLKARGRYGQAIEDSGEKGSAAPVE